MPSYEYKAKDASGNVVSGTMVAETEREVIFSLDKQGLFPLELKGGAEGQAETRPINRRIRNSEVITLTRELSDLLRAGVPIDRALALIGEHTPNERLGQIVNTLQREVSAGATLHQALEKHPNLFPPFYVSIVKAAETGGFLEDALYRISVFSEKDEELRSRIRSALAYPILLTVIGAGAVIFLMWFFIPRFSEIFQSFDADLPAVTRILVGISTFTRDYGLVIVAAIVLGVILLRRELKTDRGRWLRDRLLLRVPVLGDLLRGRSLGRFTRTLGTMLKSGVPILESMRIAKESMGNVVLMREIDDAALGVKRGDKLGQALGRSAQIPKLASSMILVGEESGNLENVLIQIADSVEIQVDRSVKTFVSLFEPVLLVVMAAVVGFIVISMLLPVFTISTIVK